MSTARIRNISVALAVLFLVVVAMTVRAVWIADTHSLAATVSRLRAMSCENDGTARPISTPSTASVTISSISDTPDCFPIPAVDRALRLARLPMPAPLAD